MKNITRTINMTKFEATGINLLTGEKEVRELVLPEEILVSSSPVNEMSTETFKVAVFRIISSMEVKFAMPLKQFVEQAEVKSVKENNND